MMAWAARQTPQVLAMVSDQTHFGRRFHQNHQRDRKRRHTKQSSLRRRQASRRPQQCLSKLICRNPHRNREDWHPPPWIAPMGHCQRTVLSYLLTRRRVARRRSRETSGPTVQAKENARDEHFLLLLFAPPRGSGPPQPVP